MVRGFVFEMGKLFFRGFLTPLKNMKIHPSPPPWKPRPLGPCPDDRAQTSVFPTIRKSLLHDFLRGQFPPSNQGFLGPCPDDRARNSVQDSLNESSVRPNPTLVFAKILFLANPGSILNCPFLRSVNPNGPRGGFVECFLGGIRGVESDKIVKMFLPKLGSDFVV